MQIVRRWPGALAAPALTLLALGSCEGELPSRSDADHHVLAHDQQEVGALIAEVELDDGGVIRFFDAGDHIALMEVFDAGSASLVHEMLRDGMSPFEVFLATAPPEMPVPSALARKGSGVPAAFANPPAAGGFTCAGNDCNFVVRTQQQCWQYDYDEWKWYAENVLHPDFPRYRHHNNSVSLTSISASDRSDFEASVCPYEIHQYGEGGLGDGIKVRVKRRKTTPLGSWTSLGTTPLFGIEKRAFFWDLGAAEIWQWQVEVLNIDSGVLCDPQIPWLCNDGNDRFYATLAWAPDP